MPWIIRIVCFWVWISLATSMLWWLFLSWIERECDR